VQRSLIKGGVWDAGTQLSFLKSVRTVYANALAVGSMASIGELETWILQLASAPIRRPAYQAMVSFRRVFGGGACSLRIEWLGY
jgi:hypothetical protein